MNNSAQLIRQISECKDTIDTLTQQVLSLVKDKENYSHEERWDAFCALHTVNPQEDSFIYSGWDRILEDAFGWENPIGYDSIVHADRYATVDLVDAMRYTIPDAIIWDETIRKEGRLDLTVDSPKDESVLELPLVAELLVELKEALMRDNVHSFTYDW